MLFLGTMVPIHAKYKPEAANKVRLYGQTVQIDARRCQQDVASPKQETWPMLRDRRIVLV
jgi:hypothetical protein